MRTTGSPVSAYEPSLPTRDVDDPERLAALGSYGVLDTAPEEGFDDVVAVAAEVCDAPIALVSFVSVDRQWFKAKVGFEACETPLEQSVCARDMKPRPDGLTDGQTKALRALGRQVMTLLALRRSVVDTRSELQP